MMAATRLDPWMKGYSQATLPERPAQTHGQVRPSQPSLIRGHLCGVFCLRRA
jgi:hypothetical protein